VGTPFLSEIRIAAWEFAPTGWAFCDGQFLPTGQNAALFSLIGTDFGSDSTAQNFKLPDLRGRVPIHASEGFAHGQAGGEVSHTLTPDEMPRHIHTFQGATNVAYSPNPGGNLFGSANNLYASPQNTTPMHAATVANAGNSQPHDNMQPYLVVNYIIALDGIFPSRN
jgi:microcystin-dependent protein